VRLAPSPVIGRVAVPSINLLELPRMADFAAFDEAVGRTLEWPAGTFLAAYTENRRDATN
jgi:hypothetical protein